MLHMENQIFGTVVNQNIVPTHTCDTDAVDRLNEESSETVIPLLPTLMEWLKDMNWPVAQAILPLLLKYEDETTRIAAKILQPDQTDEEWKFSIITWFVPDLSDGNKRLLIDEICRIAFHPTNSEQSGTVDDAAKEYLNGIR